jgi:hypothetical protein
MSSAPQMIGSPSPDAFPPLEARLAASICRAMAASFEELSGVLPDREMAQVAAFDVLDVLNAAGLGDVDLENQSPESLSRLTRPAVLPAVKPIWDCAVSIAQWARDNAPEEPC